MIICADTRHVLEHWPRESVDLVVTDPPYRTIGGGKNSPGSRRPVGILSKNDGKIFTHNDIKPNDYMVLLWAVLKPDSHCYVMTNEFNRRAIETALLDAGFKIHQLLVWRKNNAIPNRWYMKNYEFTFFARKGAAKPIRYPSSMAVHDVDNTRNRDHPTEKPFDLMHFYVKNSARPGDLVLDPFCGSGVTGQAAMVHRCRFVGIEIDPQYAAVARRRLES